MARLRSSTSSAPTPSARMRKSPRIWAKCCGACRATTTPAASLIRRSPPIPRTRSSSTLRAAWASDESRAPVTRARAAPPQPARGHGGRLGARGLRTDRPARNRQCGAAPAAAGLPARRQNVRHRRSPGRQWARRMGARPANRPPDPAQPARPDRRPSRQRPRWRPPLERGRHPARRTQRRRAAARGAGHRSAVCPPAALGAGCPRGRRANPRARRPRAPATGHRPGLADRLPRLRRRPPRGATRSPRHFARRRAHPPDHRFMDRPALTSPQPQPQTQPLGDDVPAQLIACPAPAKLNLFLHVVGRRADGYHLLQTAFRLLDWGDTLDFALRTDGCIRRANDVPGVAEADDLVVRAARLLQAHTGSALGADITVHKVLPMGGGLGGGSSDAATTLVALNRLWATGLSRAELQTLGLALGADVPVFVFGRDAFAEGV